MPPKLNRFNAGLYNKIKKQEKDAALRENTGKQKTSSGKQKIEVNPDEAEKASGKAFHPSICILVSQC